MREFDTCDWPGLSGIDLPGSCVERDVFFKTGGNDPGLYICIIDNNDAPVWCRLAVLNVDGSLTFDGKTVTANLIGMLLDANGEEALKIAAATTAVNWLKLTNAAANSPIQIETEGASASIGMQLIAKGTTGNILLGGYGGVAATAGAATGATQRGYVTTEALTTAAGTAYVLTLTNPHIALNSVLLFQVENGTNTQGIVVPAKSKATGAGTGTFEVYNLHASQAFNGTLLISYLIC